MPMLPLRQGGDSGPSTALPSSLDAESIQQRGSRDPGVDAKGLAPGAWAFINWSALEMATMTFPPLFQMWVAKHASGFCRVGRMMKIWGFWQEDICPCCHLGKVETMGHLWCCPAA